GPHRPGRGNPAGDARRELQADRRRAELEIAGEDHSPSSWPSPARMKRLSTLTPTLSHQGRGRPKGEASPGSLLFHGCQHFPDVGQFPDGIDLDPGDPAFFIDEDVRTLREALLAEQAEGGRDLPVGP